MFELQIVNGLRLAELLSVSPETIRAWRQRGIIPGIQINATTIRYDVRDVIAALKGRSNGARARDGETLNATPPGPES